MSDFASLLSSFKTNAASAAATPPTTEVATRKRPLQPNTYPSLQNQLSKRSFDLSFLIIGGQKCGTTWVHTLLLKCKLISLPKQKEVHFWDWHYRKGIDWYIRQFEKGTASKHAGEITPDYVVLPPTAIAEIYKCFPNLRIVFIARDLVERTWSAMTMELHDQNMGLNPGDFAEGVIDGDHRGSKRVKQNPSAAQQRRMQQLSSPSSQPDSYYLERMHSLVHKSRSDYATSLKNWYDYFPDESILLIDYSEIQSNPRGLLHKIVSHIGLDEDITKKYVEGLEEADVRQRVNVSKDCNTSGGKTQGSLNSLYARPCLKRQMEKFLSSHAISFNKLLREKRYMWTLNEYRET